MPGSKEMSKTAPVADLDVLRTSAQRSAGRVPTQAYDEVALLSALESRYEFGRWLSAQRTEDGLSNDSWLVETESGDIFVRRSASIKTQESAMFEVALFDHLMAAGFPCPPVLRTREGQALVEIDDRFHMVMRRLPGVSYKKDDVVNLPVAARALGRYHRIVATLPMDLTAHESSAVQALHNAGAEQLHEAMDVIKPLISASTLARAEADAAGLADRMEFVWKRIDEELDELTYLIVHGSFGASSLLVVGQQLSGVVDFDRARHDLLDFDLVYAVEHFCRRNDKRAGKVVDKRLYAKFLKHYRAASPATDADIEAIPLFMAAQRLSKVAKRANSFLAKHAVAPREARDAADFARMLHKETTRLLWIERNMT